MARVTRVKKAQQRYETVIVRNEDGTPKRTPVMKGDTQKVTKRGTPVFMTVTVQDRSKPKPPYKCDYPACPYPDRVIEIGTPYKHITPKSGPYGGTKKTRHDTCPTWQVWEYSSSLSARLSQVSYDYEQAIDQAESPDDVTTALADAAASITEIAEEKEESANNIEEGFGHETSTSSELKEVAESLTSWASDIEQAQVPDMVDCEECTDGKVECDTCGGDGEIEVEAGAGLTKCEDCDGEGTVTCETCDGTGEDIDAWRDQVRDEVTIVDESPV